MTALVLDFETRSRVDLKARGLDNYASDPSTMPLCMAWALGDEEPLLWAPPVILPLKAEEHVASGGLVIAQNAAFELAIWNRICVPRFGWPVLRIEQVADTMAMAYAMGLPGGLEGACAAVGLDVQKDNVGYRTMLQLCKPKADGTWHTDPAKYDILYEYCRQDVRAERALYQRLLKLSDSETRLWRLDHKINARGFAIDVDAVRAAERMVKLETAALNERMNAVTEGGVAAVTNVGQLADWVKARGVDLPSLNKKDVAVALSRPLPDAVRQALLLRQEGARTSTAKLDKMLTRMSADGRVRGTKQYHGAATGRWAGRDVQPDNLPRAEEGVDYEEVIRLIKAGDAAAIDNLYGPPLRLVSESLRSVICAPPGRILFDADFSNIEGRGLAWAAGEVWKLDAFRAFDSGKGPDLYKIAYSRSFGVPVEHITKAQRQVGKVQELALGYQGAYGALLTMAGGKLEIPPMPPKDENDRQPPHPWVKGWRTAHPNIVKWWHALEDAAKNAVRNPGQKFTVGPPGREVVYKVDGSFLWCRLQSGRVLCYPYPRVGEAKVPWGTKPDALLYRYVDQTTRKWVEGPTYGGSLAENIVQAIARDVLAEAMPRVEAAGYEIVMHVHDSILAERDEGTGSVEEFSALMAQVPAWAAGWPISVAAKCGRRWG